MKKVIMYKYVGTYENEAGEEKTATYITPAKIRGAEGREEMVRLVADEGMMLSNDGGVTLVEAVDIAAEDADRWAEYPKPVEE